MADIVQELREPIPKVEGYSGEYVDEDAVLSIFKDAADEIERLREVLHDLLVRTPLWLEDTKINVEMAERYREARAKAYAVLGDGKDG